MADARWERLWDLFHGALDQPEDRRDAFLCEACGDDEALRAEVADLLRLHQRDGDLLSESPVERFNETTAPARDPLVGGRVGPYRIRAVIGQGGMGVVYDAEQQDPIRRRVALKLVKLGMDTREVVARFEAERQALAMMNHPNIARVFDAGATGDGRPYFVMEYVAGIPITRYADEHRLTTAERLRLLLPVCDAIQHAHQKGIIHRDLKPSNVLVTVEQGRAVPKVIDFGVAKATRQRLTERTLHTELGRLVGTPEYMSPEQARLTELDVDTRTDIYALGVMLYELITGRLPFDPARLRGAGYDEIHRIIREEQPPRPSARVRTLDGEDAAAVARDHGAMPAAIAREVRGDLDWVTLTAMDKDRTRRYQTAGELMADLRRYLEHRPVLAGAPGAAHRVAKFVRRHRASVTVAAVFATLVLGFAATMTVQSMRLARALDDTERERAKAMQLSDILVEQVLTLPDPALRKGASVTVLEVLEQAKRIADSLQDQPELRATVLDAVGRVYQNLGRYEDSRALFNEALDLRRKVLGPEHADVATSLNHLASSLAYLDELDQAERLLRQALAMRRRVHGDEHLTVAESMNDLALVLSEKGDYAGAEAMFRDSLALRRRLLGPGDVQVAQSLNNLGIVLRREARYDDAESCYRQALVIWRARLGDEHPDIAMTLNNLALVLHVKGDYDESEAMFREALAMRRKLLGAEHPWVALTAANLAQLLRDRGDYEEAEALHRDALAMRIKTFGEQHTYVAQSMTNLASVLRLRGKLNEAEPLQRRALEMVRHLLGEHHPRYASDLAQLGAILVDEGDYDRAEPLLRRALEMQREQLGERHPRVASTLTSLAKLYAARGDDADAERSFDDALALRREVLGDHPDTARVLMAYGSYLARRGEPGRGEPMLREALSMLRARLPDGSPLTDDAERRLADCAGASEARGR